VEHVPHVTRGNPSPPYLFSFPLPHLLLYLLLFHFPFRIRFIYFLAFHPFQFYQNSPTLFPGQMS